MAAVEESGNVDMQCIEKKYSSNEYCKGLNSSLNTFRQHQTLCDVWLIMEGREFPAHRAVLAGASSYFQNLFTIDMKEKGEEKVKLEELKCAVMEDFLEFIYTGDVLLTKSNAVELLKAANYTNVYHLERLCEEFLNETLSLENCLSVYHHAEMFNCQELKKGSCNFIKKHFSKVLGLPEFLEMTESELEFYLGSDDIVVKAEEEVYEGLLKWVKHQPDARKNRFAKLFSFVRVGCLSKQFLSSTVSNEEMVFGDLNCLQLALKALTASADQCNVSQKPRDCLNKFAEAIIVCGGFTGTGEKIKSNSCFMPSLNTWFKLEDFEGRADSCSVELDGFLYVFGVSTERKHGLPQKMSYGSRYDSKTNSWTTVAPMIKAVANSTAVTLDGKIYVIGGFCKPETVNTVQKYSQDTNSWELVRPLTVGRAHACSVSDGVNIFVIGGCTHGEPPNFNREFFDSCEKYDQRSDSWLRISSMNEKRALAAIAVLQQQIFVMAGYHGRQVIASCEVYNIPLDTWSKIASLQVSRCLAGAAVVDNMIYIIGGKNNANEYLQAVECYSKERSEWQVVSRMQKGRACAAVFTMMFPKTFLDSCPKL